jgi:hypothetical protein
MENLIQYKWLRSEARRIMKDSKSASWRAYVSSVSRRISSKVIWCKLHKIQDTRSTVTIPGLLVNGSLLTTPDEIVEELGNHFADVLSSKHYIPAFLLFKTWEENRPLDFCS